MTNELTSELKNLIAQQEQAKRELREKAEKRLRVIAQEADELRTLLTQLGAVDTVAVPEAPRKRGPTKKVTNKPVVVTDTEDAAENEASSRKTGPRNPERAAALNDAVIECVRVNGPIDIKAIVSKIESKVEGVRYDTVAKVLTEKGTLFNVEGTKPRLYSVA